jgi:hypothetical protein
MDGAKKSGALPGEFGRTQKKEHRSIICGKYAAASRFPTPFAEVRSSLCLVIFSERVDQIAQKPLLW